ncbi:transmembrane amino acid transporter protein, partial [Oesophagostomum dentatum]
MIRSSYAFINLVKALCGVGVFTLPVAFQQSGLWAGVALAFILGFVNAHSMIMLVECSQYLCKKKLLEETKNDLDDMITITPVQKVRDDKTSIGKNISEKQALQDSAEKSSQEVEENRVTLNYGDMAEEAFKSHKSQALKKLGKPIKIAVNVCVFAFQLGVCSAFYIFVVDHAKEVIDHLFSTHLSRDMLFFEILPFFLLMASVRSLIILSWIGLLGNILVISAIVIIVGQMMFMEHVPLSYLPAVTSVEGVTLAAGSMIYAYAAQGVVLPLENKMRKPQHMLGLLGVISTSVGFVSILYTVTGFLGYITYGDQLKGSITLNLTNSPLDFSVKVMLLIMTYCGYLIQHYPVVEMCSPFVQNRLKDASSCTILASDYALRYIIVFMSFGFAYAIPDFKDIIPFIGVTSGMMLALVFPPLLELVVFIGVWRRGNVIKMML